MSVQNMHGKNCKSAWRNSSFFPQCWRINIVYCISITNCQFRICMDFFLSINCNSAWRNCWLCLLQNHKKLSVQNMHGQNSISAMRYWLPRYQWWDFQWYPVIFYLSTSSFSHNVSKCSLNTAKTYKLLYTYRKEIQCIDKSCIKFCPLFPIISLRRLSVINRLHMIMIFETML